MQPFSAVYMFHERIDLFFRRSASVDHVLMHSTNEILPA